MFKSDVFGFQFCEDAAFRDQLFPRFDYIFFHPYLRLNRAIGRHLSMVSPYPQLRSAFARPGYAGDIAVCIAVDENKFDKICAVIVVANLPSLPGDDC